MRGCSVAMQAADVFGRLQLRIARAIEMGPRAISETVHEFYIRQPVNPERDEVRGKTPSFGANDPARCETCGQRGHK